VTKLRAAAALETASLQPSRLPPAAILCIRTVRDPRPRTVRLHSLQPFGRQHLASDWQRALTARLDDLSRRAARPLVEDVPAGAEAVVFADHAELLACLARDWLRGRVLERWWWTHLVRQLNARQAAVQTWVESPDAIPAALVHLDRWRAAVEFLAALSPTEVARITDAVIDRFGLRAAAQALREGQATAPPLGSPTNRGPTPPSTAIGGGPISDAPIHASPVRAPWANHLPIDASALSVEREFVLGVCLHLARRPDEVRAPTFASAVHAWAAARARNVGAVRLESTPEHVPPPDSLGEFLDRPHLRAPSDIPEETAGQSVSTPGAPTARLSAAATAHPAPAFPGIPARETEPPANVAPRPEPGAARTLEPPRVPALSPPPLVDEVRTGLGGVFFLVTAALSLGLYADFTLPEGENLDLAVWDFLTLLGQHLLPEPDDGDPLWPLLAQLAGHPDEPPASSLDLAGTPWAADVHARLVDALGLQDEPDRLADVLLRHPARLQVTSTRVDVEFNLNDFFAREGAFAIRLSGLDRDPGWVPAAGRTIAFHFL